MERRAAAARLAEEAASTVRAGGAQRCKRSYAYVDKRRTPFDVSTVLPAEPLLPGRCHSLRSRGQSEKDRRRQVDDVVF